MTTIATVTTNDHWLEIIDSPAANVKWLKRLQAHIISASSNYLCGWCALPSAERKSSGDTFESRHNNHSDRCTDQSIHVRHAHCRCQ